MSPGDKPDPARGWQFVEKPLAVDREQRDRANDKIERQMTTEKLDAERVPSAEELLAKAEERAAKRPDGVVGGATVRAIARVRSAPWWLWLALAALCGLAVFAVVRRPATPALKGAPALARASELRQAAFRDCGAKEWKRCWKGLDEARDLDQEGDLSPLVVRARARAAAGMGTRPPGDIGGPSER